MTVFSIEGIWPARREQFIILAMSGEMAKVLAFSRAEEKGSRELVDGFIFLMMSSTSSFVAVKTEQMG